MRSEPGGVFDVAILEQQPGFTVLRIVGADQLMNSEPGGHRWQGASGKKGQIHTSTVTVAVLPEAENAVAKLDMRDVEITTYRASGPGGQHRNKTDSAVRATHTPTGTVARSESERSQHVNKQQALAALAAKLAQHVADTARASRAADRRNQVGTGQRGDKVRTIREQDGIVTDHRLNRKGQLKTYLRGDLDWLME